jgi:hypothetical protein
MVRRFLLVCGLIFLALWAAGLVALPNSGLVRGERTINLVMPDDLARMPAERSAVLQASPLIRPPFESPSTGPLAGVLAIAFLAIAVTLVTAHGRTETGAISPIGITALIWLGIFSACLVATVLGLASIFFPPRLSAEIAEAEMTNAHMVTMLANTDQAMTAAVPTVPPEVAQELTATAQNAPTVEPIGPTWTPRPVMTGIPEPLELRVEWPAQIDAGEKGWIYVYLSRPAFFEEPWASPHPPYADPFGANYKGTIRAEITSGDLALTPWDQLEEVTSLDSSGFAWNWYIDAPPSPGQRELNLRIHATWQPADGQGEPIQWDVAHVTMITSVTRPLIDPDLLGWLTFGAGVIGIGLCVPWLYGMFKRG